MTHSATRNPPLTKLTHEIYMLRCIQLAKNGLGTTYPNPMVGSVIVHNGKIIGEGWHRKAGEPHAEVNAVQSVKNKELLKESTIYVSLEPCSHFGKTPPCSDLIIQSKIPKVVVGTMDHHAKVNGAGIQKLKDAGVEVIYGVLEKECMELNKRFFTFHQKKRPYIILKWAETANGFMADSQPGQRWISNRFAKQLVHKWRSEEASILAGTNTAKIDNPKLDVREYSAKNPLRVTIDKDLTLGKDLNLMDGSVPTVVFTAKSAVSTTNLTYHQINFDENTEEQILQYLYENEVQSLIIEGGNYTLQSFVNKGLWDEYRIFVSQDSWPDGIKSPNIKSGREVLEKVGDNLLKIGYLAI